MNTAARFKIVAAWAERTVLIAGISATALLATANLALAAPPTPATPAPTTGYKLPSNCKVIAIVTKNTTFNDVLGAILGGAPWLALVFASIAIVLYIVVSKSEKARPKFMSWLAYIFAGLFALNLVGSIIGTVAPSSCVST